MGDDVALLAVRAGVPCRRRRREEGDTGGENADAGHPAQAEETRSAVHGRPPFPDRALARWPRRNLQAAL